MNAYVDPDLCIGCTQCAGLCPAVFQMEGTLAVAQPGPIPPEEVPQAVDASRSKREGRQPCWRLSLFFTQKSPAGHGFVV